MIWLLAVVLLLTACSGISAVSEDNTPQEIIENLPEAETVLRIAVLPILDAFPLYVAQEQGYFTDQNLTIELVPVNSGPERDQLMQAGQIDAMINELVSVLFYNQTETKVVVVRFARTATVDSPVFSILAAAGLGIESPADLAGVEIGVSEGTVIDYMTDRVLQNAGLSLEEIVKSRFPASLIGWRCCSQVS